MKVEDKLNLKLTENKHFIKRKLCNYCLLK